MNNLARLTVALCAACLATQVAVMADEEKSSSTQTTTPAGTASTSSQSSTNATGTSTKVKHAVSTPGQSSSETYKASAGPKGAKVSRTKTNVQGNADGSVSSTREHESHAVGSTGSAHHQSTSSSTVSPDGSTSEAKQDTRTTTK